MVLGSAAAREGEQEAGCVPVSWGQAQTAGNWAAGAEAGER